LPPRESSGQLAGQKERLQQRREEAVIVDLRLLILSGLLHDIWRRQGCGLNQRFFQIELLENLYIGFQRAAGDQTRERERLRR
jgi:hypothetical protein